MLGTKRGGKVREGEVYGLREIVIDAHPLFWSLVYLQLSFQSSEHVAHHVRERPAAQYRLESLHPSQHCAIASLPSLKTSSKRTATGDEGTDYNPRKVQ